MKRSFIMALGIGAGLCALTGPSHAAELGSRVLFTRDATYEQYLHVQANPDEKITPARVIRWIMGLRGQQVAPPSAMEFAPVVDAGDHKVRVVAAVTYKFF